MYTPRGPTVVLSKSLDVTEGRNSIKRPRNGRHTHYPDKRNYPRVYVMFYKPNSPCRRQTDPYYRNRVVDRKSQVRHLYVGLHWTTPRTV